MAMSKVDSSFHFPNSDNASPLVDFTDPIPQFMEDAITRLELELKERSFFNERIMRPSAIPARSRRDRRSRPA